MVTNKVQVSRLVTSNRKVVFELKVVFIKLLRYFEQKSHQ